MHRRARDWIATALALVALGAPRLASADAYAFGGASRRVRMEIVLLGFNEGAGVDGWDARTARDFATFAKRVDRILPMGASLSLDRDVDDDLTRLTIWSGRSRRVLDVEGAPDYDAALEAVAAHLAVAKPPPVPAAKLYTIQIFASSSEEGASRFAAAFDERHVAPEGSFFHEACLPCRVPEAHVLTPGGRQVYRVVAGIYDGSRAARRALERFKRASRLANAFVRELP